MYGMDDGLGQALVAPVAVGPKKAGGVAFRRYLIPPGQSSASRPRVGRCPPGKRFVGWQDQCPEGMVCTQVHTPLCTSESLYAERKTGSVPGVAPDGNGSASVGSRNGKLPVWVIPAALVALKMLA